MRKNQRAEPDPPLIRIGYYFDLLRVRLMSLERYALRAPYPRDLIKKILLTEIAYVQIRKILELTMFMSVSAHEISEVELSSKIRNGWNADKLMSWLSNVSQHYFPHPIDIEPVIEEELGQFVDASSRRNCLNPMGLKLYYTKCGEVLHEQIDTITHEQIDCLHEKATAFFWLSRNLFKTFSFEIAIGSKIVVGQLNYGEAKPPEVFYASFV